MLRKFATATIISAEIAQRNALGLVKASHRAVFNYEPRPGFLYVRSRMISSRCNDNHDEFPAEDIKASWKTAIGKPAFVNHHNEDHRRMRGVIIDAVLHEDVLPTSEPDTWIEALHEVDAVRFPKLAQAIISGRINRTSMGCDVGFSVCSACGNKASTPAEYCEHIPRMKGKILYRHTASGKREGHLIREICHKLSFFENSFLVEDPADPTAVVTGIDDRGLKTTASLPGRSSSLPEPGKDYLPWRDRPKGAPSADPEEPAMSRDQTSFLLPRPEIGPAIMPINPFEQCVGCGADLQVKPYHHVQRGDTQLGVCNDCQKEMGIGVKRGEPDYVNRREAPRKFPHETMPMLPLKPSLNVLDKSTGSLHKEAIPEGMRYHFAPAGTDDAMDHKVEALIPNEKGHLESAGYLQWHRNHGMVSMVSTPDEYRGQGIATALWEKAHEISGQRGLTPPRHSDVKSPAGIGWSRSVDQRELPNTPGRGQEALFSEPEGYGLMEGPHAPRGNTLREHLGLDHGYQVNHPRFQRLTDDQVQAEHDNKHKHENAYTRPQWIHSHASLDSKTAALPNDMRFTYNEPDDYLPAHRVSVDFKAKNGRRVKGGHIWWHPEDGSVIHVQVPRKYQGSGIASALWQRAHEVASARGLPTPVHSDVQTPQGKQWAKSVDEKGLPPMPGPGQEELFDIPAERKTKINTTSLKKLAEHYVECDEGHEHWGPYGAAGLLICHHGDDGQTRYLLQRRAGWVDHGGTWGIPGGALHEDESPEEGAYRETREEMGELPTLRHHDTHTDDHGGWAYHTVIADAPHQFITGRGRDGESTDHNWFTANEMRHLPLHPGFAESLPQTIGKEAGIFRKKKPIDWMENPDRKVTDLNNGFHVMDHLTRDHGWSGEAFQGAGQEGWRKTHDRLHREGVPGMTDDEGMHFHGAQHIARVAYPNPADHPFFKKYPVSAENIIHSFKQADSGRRAQGMRWYSDAHHLAGLIADGDHAKGAGVLAAYSPKAAWPDNMFNAARSFKEGRALGLGEGASIMGQHQRTAQKIMDGIHHSVAMKSPKISDFAHLIEHGDDTPEDKEAGRTRVVIDRHALSVATGQRMTTADLNDAPLNSRHYYEHVADKYREAARRLSDEYGEDIKPHQVQAVTWGVQQEANQAEDEAAAEARAKGRNTRTRNSWTRWTDLSKGEYPHLHEGEPPNLHGRNPYAEQEKTASSLPSLHLAYGETKAPADVDTLRTESCPVCGETSAFDGDRCDVCNFVLPPPMFQDPDTSVAKQMDLDKEEFDQGVTLPNGEPAPDVDSQEEAMEDVPGQPDDDVADLFCPACGFSVDAQEPMTTNDPSMPSQEGVVEGDICPNCGEATLLSPNDVAQMGGEVPQEVAEDGDADGIPDEDEPDADEDGIPDDSDPDADGDGIPDEDEGLEAPDADGDEDEEAESDDPGSRDPVEDEDEAPKGRKDNSRRAK